MRIQTNVAALNAWRNLSNTSNAMGKNLEKLSSGFRINKAADDAAGLAISEKMRAQIKGLNQAQRNAQDGISLIQTAEGAMGEIQSILQRMRELADQASSDGLTDNDRGQIQKEVDQLAKQITDVSNTTQFNTKKVLTGEFGNTSSITIQTGANKGENMQFNIAAVDAKSLNVGRARQTASVTSEGVDLFADVPGFTINGASLKSEIYTVAFTKGTAEVLVNGPSGVDVLATPTSAQKIGSSVSSGEYTIKLNYTKTGDIRAYTLIKSDGSTVAGTYTGTNTVTFGTAGTSDEITLDVADAATGDPAADGEYTAKIKITGATLQLEDSLGNAIGSPVSNPVANSTVTLGDGAVSFKMASSIPATSGVATFTVGDVDASYASGEAANGWSATTYGGLSVSTKSLADSAIETLDFAINKVSGFRAELGALQNRLEHSITNLQSTSENLSSAESRIRDVDMAQEMTQFSRSQILVQAGTAMLAQANQLPQAVLKLLG